MSWESVTAEQRTTYANGVMWPTWVYAQPSDIEEAPESHAVMADPIKTVCGLMMDGSLGVYKHRDQFDFTVIWSQSNLLSILIIMKAWGQKDGYMRLTNGKLFQRNKKAQQQAFGKYHRGQWDYTFAVHRQQDVYNICKTDENPGHLGRWVTSFQWMGSCGKYLPSAANLRREVRPGRLLPQSKQ